MSRGLFVLSPFFAITYTDIWALIFFKIVIYMFEFSLKIVYNRLGYFNQRGCIFKFCPRAAKLGYSA
jgi:hypothetical protein